MTSAFRVFLALYLLIGVFCVEAYAAEKPASYCLAAASIAKKAVICRHNDQFVSWGKLCLERFEKQVSQETGRLSAQITLGENPKFSQQAGAMAKTAADYHQAIASIHQLIDLNKAAVSDIGAYLKTLITPIDDTYLEEVKCYTENRGSLRKVLGDFEKKLSQLEATKAAAEAYWAQSKGREAEIANSGGEGATIIKGGKTDKQPIMVKKKSTTSDITGTEENKAKKPK